ncbi:MAG TPA: hypothetical protein VF331_13150 [Polyangiales bacterium]
MSFDPATLLASMVVSSIGWVLFSYGRKQHRLPHAVVGVVMLVYPYVVTNIALMFGIMGALLALLFAVTHFLEI